MSDICQVYQREIRAPVEILLRVEMTDAGLIDHIDSETYDDLPAVYDLMVMRAMLLISDMVQGLNNRGDLVADAVAALPETPDFAIERSILVALAELQGEVLTKHIKGRAA